MTSSLIARRLGDVPVRVAASPAYLLQHGTPQPYASALLIHGKANDVIPFSESESAAQRLQATGVNIEAHYEAATGHTISAQGAMQAAAYIAQYLQD